ncbi:MAG: DUF6677 family protein [Planctomycetaceae bacterium]
MGRQEPATVQRVIALSPDDGAAIDLRDPALAALLSWLAPGLGQLWQGRRRKGLLFMAAVVGTLVAGLWIGGGKVAYCQWRTGSRRIEFLGQAGVGAVAIPAVIQAWSLSATGRPFLPGGLFVPPLMQHQPVSPAYAARLGRTAPDLSFYRDVRDGTLRSAGDQLSAWYLALGRFFDIGTLYVTIAGLLNMLVVYDAWAGPLHESEPAAKDAAAGRGRRRGSAP